MTFKQLEGLAFGRISVEELSLTLVQDLKASSIAEATTLVTAAEESLQAAIEAGDEALQLEIQRIDAIIGGEGGESIADQISAIKGRLELLEAADVTLQENINDVSGALTEHVTAYTKKVGELVDEDARLQTEIEKVKAAIGDKNSNTKVFADFAEFNASVTAEGYVPKVGDLAFVLDIKKAYIYKGEDTVETLELPTPPQGWIYFDEISTEMDLNDYAKKSEVTAEIGIAVAALEKADATLQGAIETEVSRAKAEEISIRSDFAAADATLKTSLEGQINAVDGKVVTETTEREKEITRVEGLVSAEAERAKGAEAALQVKVDSNKAAIDAEVVRAKAEEGKIRSEFADADVVTLTSAKGYTDAEIIKVNGANEALAGRVEVLETSMEAVPSQIAAGVELAKGHTDTEIAALDKRLSLVDTGLRDDLTTAQKDILANAGKIAELVARRFILTRTQQIIVVQAETLSYALQLPVANAIIDVHANTVVLEQGVDYTIEDGNIVFANQYSVGKKIQVLFTYNDMK